MLCQLLEKVSAPHCFHCRCLSGHSVLIVSVVRNSCKYDSGLIVFCGVTVFQYIILCALYFANVPS